MKPPKIILKHKPRLNSRPYSKHWHSQRRQQDTSTENYSRSMNNIKKETSISRICWVGKAQRKIFEAITTWICQEPAETSRIRTCILQTWASSKTVGKTARWLAAWVQTQVDWTNHTMTVSIKEWSAWCRIIMCQCKVNKSMSTHLWDLTCARIV